MNFKLTLINRILFTAIVTLLSWVHLAWDYFHGGIPTHYLLHRKDLPGISNWWGGIVIPLLTWFLLYRIKRRVYDKDINEASNTPNHVIYGFFGALLFGILLSFFFATGILMLIFSGNYIGLLMANENAVVTNAKQLP